MYYFGLNSYSSWINAYVKFSKPLIQGKSICELLMIIPYRSHNTKTTLQRNKRGFYVKITVAKDFDISRNVDASMNQ